jgi:hypothetical protein
MENENVKKGIVLVEQLWWSLAKRIVFLAGNLYKWDEEQWREANEKFLRPNDYKVIDWS